MEFDISIFAQLSMANRMQNELIPSHRKKLNKMVDTFYDMPEQKEHRELYALWRNLKPEVIHRNKMFYIDDRWVLSNIPEEFRHDSFDICKGPRIKFLGRYCFPIYDPMGDVMGFVGWDGYEEVRYLDSITYGYKAKVTTLYGMEKLRRAYKQGYVVVVEGPVCKLYIEGFGLLSLSLLGSNMSDYVARILRRFGERCILVPDADEAGDKLVSLSKYMVPQARVYQSVIAKDVDDTRKAMGNDDIIQELIAIVKDKTFKGRILKRM